MSILCIFPKGYSRLVVKVLPQECRFRATTVIPLCNGFRQAAMPGGGSLCPKGLPS